jgi:hypothetical protein
MHALIASLDGCPSSRRHNLIEKLIPVERLNCRVVDRLLFFSSTSARVAIPIHHSQLFIRMYNKKLFVAMRVSNPDSSPLRIKG